MKEKKKRYVKTFNFPDESHVKDYCGFLFLILKDITFDDHNFWSYSHKKYQSLAFRKFIKKYITEHKNEITNLEYEKFESEFMKKYKEEMKND